MLLTVDMDVGLVELNPDKILAATKEQASPTPRASQTRAEEATVFLGKPSEPLLHLIMPKIAAK